jgi:SAM-dependent methyltransferase
MSADAQQTLRFYASPQGIVAQRLLGSRLATIWPTSAGLSMLGIGYAGPYLRPHLAQAARCLSLTQAQTGTAAWPETAASLSCTAEEDALPFPDLCFDRVMSIHGLEAAENARRLLREAWRTLKDDGRLIVVAPNRRGWWAYRENTPFGQGQPYSPGQIGRLLKSSLFRVEQRDTALYLPPTPWKPILKTAQLWETLGRALAPQLAGVTITEATKDLYGAVPIASRQRRRLVLTEAG